MPGCEDRGFAQTVTLVCEHGEKGALGIVLNKPLPMRLAEVLAQMQLPARSETIGGQAVLRGGPVHQDRGFVLHRPGGKWESTHRISDTIQVTTSRDVLAAMARGEGPENAFIALGYTGWEPGQLEQELKDNAWTPCRSTKPCCSTCRMKIAWFGSVADAGNQCQRREFSRRSRSQQRWTRA